MNKWKLWLLTGVIIVLGVFVLSGCGNKKINLNDYVTYSFSGYDGYGSVQTLIDGEALYQTLAKALGINVEKAADPSSEDGVKLRNAQDVIGQGVRGSWDKEYELSNGDTVTYHFDVNEEALKALEKVEFQWKDIETKVSGLEKVGEFDPFEGMTVSAEGYDTYGTLTFSNPDYSSLSFLADRTFSLSNGDEVTITLQEMSPEYMISLYGGLPSKTELKYTVSGLKEIGSFDPFEDLKVTVSGYDTLGTIQIFSDKYPELSFYADMSGRLSNGDEITITMQEEPLEWIVDLYGATPSKTEMTYTVEGLEELATFDPFEELQIVCSGIEPNGTLSIASSLYPGLTYYADRSSGLSNGDTVTIYIDSVDPADMLAWYDALPERTEMEYTVEGVTEYVKSLEDLPEDLETQILRQTEDLVRAWYADNENKTISDYEILGYYLLTPKGNNSWTHNQFYVVYRTNISYSDGNSIDETVTTYKYLKFHDLLRYPDGTGYVDIMDYTNPVVPGWAYYGDEGYYITSANGINYAGFKDLSTLENQCITSQKAEWYVDSSVKGSALSSEESAARIKSPDAGTASEFITKLEEIPDSLDETMKRQLKDIVDSIVANYPDSDLLDYEVLGEYLLTPKGYAYSQNMLYILCRADVRSRRDGASEDIPCYLYIQFQDLLRYEDGTGYVDLMNYTCSGKNTNETFTSPLNLTYAGYSSQSLLENQCISSKKADWNVEYRAEEQEADLQSGTEAAQEEDAW